MSRQSKFGKQLKELRKALGLSQQEIAEVANVSRFSVISWEKGRGVPDALQLFDIAKELGRDVRDFEV
ncbi:helix-turn-helix transcriptional regulator [Pantanalinema sp. GBBB05]|uniref:helix-turn-helix transcriptional regulator n=1 Tax=Pantanalinema sp. GBBB05 TaxID=2604139 RepID=UPI001DD777D1|nr:helix-turn-helix transcriptional regulator [Pantanalinema sp. GBBB05]